VNTRGYPAIGYFVSVSTEAQMLFRAGRRECGCGWWMESLAQFH